MSCEYDVYFLKNYENNYKIVKNHIFASAHQSTYRKSNGVVILRFFLYTSYSFINFLPLFWLYFIRRIYENGDKVKVLPNRLPPKKVVVVLLPKSRHGKVEKV